MTAPLGIRSNNPGNLRPTASKWVGELEPDPRGYCRFDTPENGIRALAKNLLAYYERHNLRTVRDIIGRWAPPAENDTDAYVDSVSEETGFRPNERLDMRESWVLRDLTLAIIRHENGVQPYAYDVVDAAIKRALE